MTRRAGWKARLVTTIAAIIALTVLATPVAADTLVSNLGGTSFSLGQDKRLSVNDFAQSFTTGTNASGYQLESISIDFAIARRHKHDPVYVYLHPDNGNNRPNHSDQLATLTKNRINFEGPVAGVNKYSGV